MGNQLYSVDRIVGETAVLVDDAENTIDVLLTDLPEGVAEGTMLSYSDGVYQVRLDEEEQRRRRAIDLQNRLRRR